MDFHGRITKEDPGAANVVVGGAGFGLQEEAAQRFVGMSGELNKEGLVHRGLRSLFSETRGGPHGDATTVRSKKHGFGEALAVNVLEKAIETIHEDVDREAAAIGERGGIITVKQVCE